MESTEHPDIGRILDLISISDFLYIGSLQLVPPFESNFGSFALSLGREVLT